MADFALVASLLARASNVSSNLGCSTAGRIDASSIERATCSTPLLLASTTR